MAALALQDPAGLLDYLRAQQTQQSLSILNLAEPILESTKHPDQANGVFEGGRPSESLSQNPALTPSSLALDLTHYKELFSKLRFSYLEQVTKEKYLRSIVGDPPVLVSPEENARLEEKLVGMKATLKGKKEEVDQLVEQMERMGSDTAASFERVTEGIQMLETAPRQIDELQAQVAALRKEVAKRREALGSDEKGREPRYTMGLEKTQAALEEQKRRNDEVEREIRELEEGLPGRVAEAERVERELEEVERRRSEVTRLAREVKRIREEGGRDEVGERGRWLTAQESVMRGLLGETS